MSQNVVVRVKNTFLDFCVQDVECVEGKVGNHRARSVDCVARATHTSTEGDRLRVWRLTTWLQPVGIDYQRPCDIDQACDGTTTRASFLKLDRVCNAMVSVEKECNTIEGSKHWSFADFSERWSLESCPRTNSSTSLSTVASCVTSPLEESSLGMTLPPPQLSKEDGPELSPKARVKLGSVQPKHVVGVVGTTSYPCKVRKDLNEFKHRNVPKLIDLAEKYGVVQKDAAPTTVMIRNIPSGYNQRELMRELNGMGFQGTYDFFYLPLDSGTMSNVGYAFVNFTDSADAARCMNSFAKYRFKYHRKTSGKVASVSVAHIQGLEANLSHYEKCAVNSPKMKQFRPVVLPVIAKSVEASEVLSVGAKESGEDNL